MGLHEIGYFDKETSGPPLFLVHEEELVPVLIKAFGHELLLLLSPANTSLSRGWLGGPLGGASPLEGAGWFHAGRVSGASAHFGKALLERRDGLVRIVRHEILFFVAQILIARHILAFVEFWRIVIVLAFII